MIYLIMFLLLIPSYVSAAPPEQPLVGSWQAIGYYYENNFIQPDDPQLTLVFDFFPDGTHRLFWKLKGENSFCERKGLWRTEEDQLFIEVTWVNPDNGASCSSDPDMKNGLKTQSKISFVNDQLWLEIPFSDTYMTYVWNPLLPAVNESIK